MTAEPRTPTPKLLDPSSGEESEAETEKPRHDLRQDDSPSLRRAKKARHQRAHSEGSLAPSEITLSRAEYVYVRPR